METGIRGKSMDSDAINITMESNIKETLWKGIRAEYAQLFFLTKHGSKETGRIAAFRDLERCCTTMVTHSRETTNSLWGVVGEFSVGQII